MQMKYFSHLIVGCVLFSSPLFSSDRSPDLKDEFTPFTKKLLTFSTVKEAEDYLKDAAKTQGQVMYWDNVAALGVQVRNYKEALLRDERNLNSMDNIHQNLKTAQKEQNARLQTYTNQMVTLLNTTAKTISSRLNRGEEEIKKILITHQQNLLNQEVIPVLNALNVTTLSDHYSEIGRLLGTLQSSVGPALAGSDSILNSPLASVSRESRQELEHLKGQFPDRSEKLAFLKAVLKKAEEIADTL